MNIIYRKIENNNKTSTELNLQGRGRCIKALPNGGDAALRSTFPELFAYIGNDLSIDHWANGSSGDQGNPGVKDDNKPVEQPKEEAFIIGDDEEKRDDSMELILIDQ